MSEHATQRFARKSEFVEAPLYPLRQIRRFADIGIG